MRTREDAMSNRKDNGTIPDRQITQWSVSDPASISMGQTDRIVNLHFVAKGGKAIVLTMPKDILKKTLDDIAGELGYTLRPIRRP